MSKSLTAAEWRAVGDRWLSRANGATRVGLCYTCKQLGSDTAYSGEDAEHIGQFKPEEAAGMHFWPMGRSRTERAFAAYFIAAQLELGA